MPSHNPVLVTFGTPDFSQARKRYFRSAEKHGISMIADMDEVSHPVQRARAENPEAFKHARGYGYWVWKPYIIKTVMGQIKSDVPILYSDIALEFVAPPRRLVEITDGHDIATFRVGSGEVQRYWTKREAFVSLKADEPRYWNDEQSCGTCILFRNTRRARDFVDEWKGAMRDTRVLDDVLGRCGPEHPDFRAHRHDQSILSILATRYGIPMFPDPSQFGRDQDGTAPLLSSSQRFVPHDAGQIFRLHRYRDRPIHRRVARWVRDRAMVTTR